MKKIPGTAILLFVLTIGCLLFLHSDKWKGGNWKHTINSDGKGYYAYLPAIFIYGDLNYDFASDYERKYYDNYNQSATFVSYIERRNVNKYFSGVAVLMAPFFLLALVLSSLFGFDVDGYSVLFQCGISIAALSYFVASLWILRKILKTYQAPEWVCMVVVLAIGFGTNLLYYTLVEPSMSHVYSFFMFTAFIYFSRKLFEKYSGRIFFWWGISLAMILLIRPSNGLVMFSLPFLAGNMEVLRRTFREIFSHVRPLVLTTLVSVIILSVQPILYKLSSGHWWVDTYVGEHFDFLHPEPWNVLFSYRKGLFVYTPMLLVCLTGLWVMFRDQRFSAVSFLLFFMLILWVISSWWSWWYGGSFGMRPFIEYFPFFGILLGKALMGFSRKISVLLLFPAATFFLLNVIQSFQSYRMILPWDEMNAVKYWRIFLKTDPKYQYMLLPSDGGPVIPAGSDSTLFKNDMEGGIEWLQSQSITNEEAFSGRRSCKLAGERKNSVTFLKTLNECFPDSAQEVILRVKFQAMMTDLESDAFLVIHVQKGDSTPMYHTYPLFHFIWEENKWTTYEKKVRLPHGLSGDHSINIYILKNDESALYLDDMELTFWYK